MIYGSIAAVVGVGGIGEGEVFSLPEGVGLEIFCTAEGDIFAVRLSGDVY